MAQATKGKLNFRCPSCFMRDIDIENTRKLEKIDNIQIFEKPEDILEKF